MAKRGRHRRRRDAPRSRPHQHHPARTEVGEPDLVGDVRDALRDEHPLTFLALVSTLLAAMDPRSEDPLALEAPEGPSLDEIVASFAGVDLPETTALLTTIAVMAPDELLRARVRREAGTRSHTLPAWLAGLGLVDAYRAVEMTHVLGDGDDIIVGARLTTGHELTIVVYIDHNVGTIVKDAMVVPEPIADLVAFMRSKVDDPDTRFDDIDRADAGAKITEAVDSAARTYPPFESESWPAARPLVEWIARLLPDGGTGYAHPEWEDDALDAIAERFLASPFGIHLDDPDHRDLVDSILWFGSGYGPGDPLRWSPVAVELILADWIPRKIVADADHLAKAPDVLRAFIRFSHHERGIRRALTDETLASVDRFEPEYQETIRSPRPQGAVALLEAIGALHSDDPWTDESFAESMLDTLRHAVGGEEALDRLDDEALPDEPFAWDGIPDDVHERVAEVTEHCDRCCDALLDVEYRTACRRLLARVARGDPNVFRRKGRPETAAAAACWIVGKANDLFATWIGGGILVKDLAAHFGLDSSGVSQRSQTLLKAGGFETEHYGRVDLGSPDYLVSARRRRIIELRDRYRAMEG